VKEVMKQVEEGANVGEVGAHWWWEGLEVESEPCAGCRMIQTCA
jgi:hypothetical protein